MKIREIMHHKTFSVQRHDALYRAAQIMWEHDLGVLPVLDEKNHAVGVITDRDIAMAAFTQGRSLMDIPVESSMSKNLYCCEPNDDIEKAYDLMG